MTAPKRIQRRRVKGWRMPKNTVYVGRPTRWGNPYRPGQYIHGGWKRNLTVQETVEIYREVLIFGTSKGVGLMLIDPWKVKAELRGKNLCCWCPVDQPCHADVLLEVANR